MQFLLESDAGLLRDAGADAATDADTDADADVDADIDAAPPSELPPSGCTVAKHQLTCDRAAGGFVSCTSDTESCPEATPGTCRDACCADEYAVTCSAGIVPTGCRLLPPNPSGFFEQFCCPCGQSN